MKTWYNRLLCNLDIAANGTVAANLEESLKAGIASIEGTKSLDANVAGDVTTWFHTSFKPWFQLLSTRLGSVTEASELVTEEYFSNINEVVKALYVARSYYSTKADEAFMTSIKEVAVFKSLICESLAIAIMQAYINSVSEYGLIVKEAGTETEASSYTGSTPEKFNWPGTVLSYHSKIVNVENEGTNQECQGTGTGSGQNQYLPWVFTAAFGLIAWAAAAKKN